MVLLVSFTHWPTLATFIDSFFSTPKGSRPAVWVGIENYQAMADDPVFWKAVKNNLWFAGATIPLSIGLAADDCGGQYLAVLLHAAVRPA